MKKVNFTIALLLLNIPFIFSQSPVITAVQHKPAVTETGSYIVYSSNTSPWVTSLNIQPGGGANLLWDFSAIATTGGQTESYSFCLNSDIECDGAAVANAYYQSSDICRVDILVNASTQLEFLGTPTGISYGGSDAEATYYWVYAPARKELIYESKYGDAPVNAAGTMTINGVAPASYTYSYCIDAYGELRLPNGKIYPKVARIKKVFYCSYYSTVIADETEYFFYDGNRNPLMRYLVDNANSKSEIRYRYNINPIAINVFTDIAAQKELDLVRISPNPAKEGIITISNLPGKVVEIEMYNSMGEKTRSCSTSDSKYTIRPDKETKGLYIIKLSYEGMTKTEKIIIN